MAIDRRLKTIQQKLDRLDNAFLYERSIDIDTYDRQKDRLHAPSTDFDLSNRRNRTSFQVLGAC